MAFARVLRRTASLAAPLLSRDARNPGPPPSAGFFTLRNGFSQGLPGTPAILSPRFLYSVAKPSSDEEFLKIIKLEIQCVKDSDDRRGVAWPGIEEDNILPNLLEMQEKDWPEKALSHDLLLGSYQLRVGLGEMLKKILRHWHRRRKDPV